MLYDLCITTYTVARHGSNIIQIKFHSIPHKTTLIIKLGYLEIRLIRLSQDPLSKLPWNGFRFYQKARIVDHPLSPKVMKLR